MKELIAILEQSVKKNGANKPLTVGHLLNIVKLANKTKAKKQKKQESFLEEVEQESYFEAENFGDRN